MTGKKIGKDNIYIHSSADTALPDHLVKRARQAAKALVEFLRRTNDETNTKAYNFVITHPNYIEFVNAESFDTTYEPVLGERYRVDNNDQVTFIPRPAKPRVLHQRYKTVKDDYKGFDQELDRKREEWYRSHFTGRDMAGAGFEHKWVAMIDRIGGFIEESHR